MIKMLTMCTVYGLRNYCLPFLCGPSQFLKCFWIYKDSSKRYTRKAPFKLSQAFRKVMVTLTITSLQSKIKLIIRPFYNLTLLNLSVVKMYTRIGQLSYFPPRMAWLLIFGFDFPYMTNIYFLAFLCLLCVFLCWTLITWIYSV